MIISLRREYLSFQEAFRAMLILADTTEEYDANHEAFNAYEPVEIGRGCKLQRCSDDAYISGAPDAVADTIEIVRLTNA